MVSDSRIQYLYIATPPGVNCVSLHVLRHLPGLWSVTVEDLVGSDQIQFPMALLEHVDPWQPAGRGDQSLLHGGWIDQLPVQDRAGGQRKQMSDS